jgi:membrane protein YqaA with SNARE-associated domain
MVETLVGLGFVGLFVACFISGTIIPFSSDIILISLVLAGWDYITCLVVASIANWGGGMVNYYLGSMGKIEWIEKHSKISVDRIDKMKIWLDGKGAYIAFFSWVPVVGNVMVVSLGYLKANILIVNISLFLGKFARYVVIVFLTVKGIQLIN